MSQSYEDAATTAQPAPLSLTTPAGLQSIAQLRWRRSVVAALNAVTYAALLCGVANVLGAGGWTIVDAVLMVAFAIGSPWTVLGFWNAVIGLWLLHGVKDPMARVAPFAAAGRSKVSLSVNTAVLMTLRNEDPARAIARLRIVKESIDATGHGGRFSYFVLSDTDNAGIFAAEEAAVAAWHSAVDDADRGRITYRRRQENTGFKAGNLRDFCARWGQQFELMVPLDADSVMTGAAVVEMVRMAEAYPRIGIIQSLVVGLPATSTFARIFQFGMRHGMRSYTMGQAWWTGDCGPFWGHNAVVRIRPFKDECELPMLPGKPPLGGPVLSHDQVEAALMRRAGYEVRVLPYEFGSYEENPPTLLDYLVRDTRWCQGNMQYVKLLDLPGLYTMSRFQLAWAVAMFIGLPAWTLMIALLPVAAWQARDVADFPTGLAASLYAAFFAMYLMPKLAGLADVVLSRGGVARYGGGVWFALSAIIELVFSFLQGASSTIRTTIFMVGLLFGKRVAWSGQARDAYGLPWRAALLALWPQTLFGIVVCGALLVISPTVLWWSLPLTAGYLLAIPFAVLTADPRVGRWFARMRLCAIPEDIAPLVELNTL
jgi:membrane glycosyltransferase